MFRTYAFHSENQCASFESSKRRLENSLTNGFDEKLSQCPKRFSARSHRSEYNQGFDKVVSDGLNKVPNNLDVTVAKIMMSAISTKVSMVYAAIYRWKKLIKR